MTAEKPDQARQQQHQQQQQPSQQIVADIASGVSGMIEDALDSKLAVLTNAMKNHFNAVETSLSALHQSQTALIEQRQLTEGAWRTRLAPEHGKAVLQPCELTTAVDWVQRLAAALQTAGVSAGAAQQATITRVAQLNLRRGLFTAMLHCSPYIIRDYCTCVMCSAAASRPMHACMSVSAAAEPCAVGGEWRGVANAADNAKACQQWERDPADQKRTEADKCNAGGGV